MSTYPHYSIEELTHEQAILLPEREALAFINVSNVVAVNLALAVNAASVDSITNAIAGQLAAVGQS